MRVTEISFIYIRERSSAPPGGINNIINIIDTRRLTPSRQSLRWRSLPWVRTPTRIGVRKEHLSLEEFSIIVWV